MGDSCCNPRSLGAVVDAIRAELGGRAAVLSLAAAPGGAEADAWSSFFGSAVEQVDGICAQLRAAPELRGGFVALGFSQGGPLMRAVAQRCQDRGPRMHTLVTMGGPHEGVADTPGCGAIAGDGPPGAAASLGCRLMQGMLGASAYSPFLQRHVIQAQYFKDPARLELYRARSAFLAPANAESTGPAGADPGWARSRENLASLRRLVLFQFDGDETVVPRESAHFGFYDGAARRLVPLRESPLYAGDRIGLRELDESGRLVLAHAPGAHMQFTIRWLAEHVVRPYLMVPAEEGGAAGGGGYLAAA